MVGRFDSARGACSAKHGLGGMMDIYRKRQMFAQAADKAKAENVPNVRRGYGRAVLRIDAIREGRTNPKHR
jgi:hypothetical protein